MHVRHEEVAAFAAGAEAALTGKLAVCTGKLRAGQFASDQRPIRLSPQPTFPFSQLRLTSHLPKLDCVIFRKLTRKTCSVSAVTMWNSSLTRSNFRASSKRR